MSRLALIGPGRLRAGELRRVRRTSKNGYEQLRLYEPDKKFGDDRLPAFWTLNLGVEKKFPIGSDGSTSATVFVDAYNLTNNDTIIGQGRGVRIGHVRQGHAQAEPGHLPVRLPREFLSVERAGSRRRKRERLCADPRSLPGRAGKGPFLSSAGTAGPAAAGPEGKP